MPTVFALLALLLALASLVNFIIGNHFAGWLLITVTGIVITVLYTRHVQMCKICRGKNDSRTS